MGEKKLKKVKRTKEEIAAEKAAQKETREEERAEKRAANVEIKETKVDNTTTVRSIVR